jgi:hypothetical protein
VFFPDEPIIRVTGALPEAQFVETRLVNLSHFQTVIASKAARMVLAAPGKSLIDYGLRRSHGAEARCTRRAGELYRGIRRHCHDRRRGWVRHPGLWNDGALLYPGAR